MSYVFDVKELFDAEGNRGFGNRTLIVGCRDVVDVRAHGEGDGLGLATFERFECRARLVARLDRRSESTDGGRHGHFLRLAF